MAESPVPSFSSVLEYLHLTLRYIASGFVAVAAFLFLYHPTKIDFADNSWFMVFLTATIGIITYAFHFATLDKIFYGWSIAKFLKRNKGFIPEVLETQIRDWAQIKKIDLKDEDLKLKKKWWIWSNHKHNSKLKRYILFAMANQRYLRSTKQSHALSEISNGLERRLALLNFLYCSFYQIVLLSVYYIIMNMIIPHCMVSIAQFSRLIMMLFFSVGLMISAIKFNRRICSREMWMIVKFGQEIGKGEILSN